MLKTLQILVLVVIGLDVVVAAFLGHLTGANALLAPALLAGVSYVLFLSRVFLADDTALLVRVAKNIYAFLAGTVRRAVVSFVIVLALPLAGIALVAYWLQYRTMQLEIHISAAGEPPMSRAEDVDFHVRIDHGTVATHCLKDGAKLIHEFSAADQHQSIVFSIDHPEYEFEPLRGNAKDFLESGLVELKPVARPALIVSVHRDGKVPEDLAAFRVSGWPHGEQKRAVDNTFSVFGETKFVTRIGWNWMVLVNDHSSNPARVHRSYPIAVTKPRESYAINLLDHDIYPWSQVSDAGGQTPRTATVPSTAFGSSSSSLAEQPDALAYFAQLHPPATETHFGHLRAALAVPVRLDVNAGPNLLVRQGYTASYNPQLKIANWVTFRLPPPEPPASPPAVDQPTPVRRFEFIRDEDLATNVAATNQDYGGSNYDRGHLVSPMDMRYLGLDAEREASLLSAVAPQTPALNRRTWLRIEWMAREYVASTHQSVYIAAGPAFLEAGHAGPAAPTREVTMIGRGVAVPTHYFRIHLRILDGATDVLAFLVPNDFDLDPDPIAYIVPLKTIQAATGLTFFPSLTEQQLLDVSYERTSLWTAPQ